MIDVTRTEQAGQIEIIEKSASSILESAESLIANGIERSDNVVAYVRELQRADTALVRTVALANEAGLETERARLARRRRSIDSAVAKQITAVAGKIGKEREKSIATLNAIFKLGHAPDVTPDGVLRGQLLSPTRFAPLDAYGRFVARFYLPWKGKRFDSSNSTGRNIFTKSAPIVGRFIWPLYSDWRHYRPGYFSAFKFNTYVGQGVNDPEVSTLKLDYDNPTNPRLLVRSVLDELVQISGGYFLGKAMLWRPSGHYKLAAFFVLRKMK